MAAALRVAMLPVRAVLSAPRLWSGQREAGKVLAAALHGHRHLRDLRIGSRSSEQGPDQKPPH